MYNFFLFVILQTFFLDKRARKPVLFREAKEGYKGKAHRISGIGKSIKKVVIFRLWVKIKILPLQHEYPCKTHRKPPLGE